MSVPIRLRLGHLAALCCACGLLLQSSQARPAAPAWVDPQQDPRVQAVFQQMRANKYAQAITSLQAIVAHPGSANPNYLAGLHHVLGMAYQDQGNVTEAEQQFTLVLSRYPRTEAAEEITTDRELRTYSTLPAEDLVAKIQRARNDAEAQEMVSAMIVRNQNRSRIAVAQAVFDAYVRRYGDNAASETLMRSLGIAYEIAGESQKSYNVFERMTHIYPDAATHPPCFIQLGYEANLMNRSDDALAFFAKASTLQPTAEERGKILLGMAICYRDKGDSAAAKRYLEEASADASARHDGELLSTIADIKPSLEATP